MPSRRVITAAPPPMLSPRTQTVQPASSVTVTSIDVGVREIVGLGVGGEGECEAFGCGPAKRIANAQVVSGKPKHACDKGLVGAVTLVGVRERSEKTKHCFLGCRAAQVSRHKRDAQRACGSEEEGPTMIGPMISRSPSVFIGMRSCFFSV